MTTTATGNRVAHRPTSLAARAATVLRDNDTGSLVTASPRLYPHMWSWDAAFIAMGLAHIDVHRAVRELRTLLAAQWHDGMIPHIVFTGDDDYFPGPDRWGTDDAPQRPRDVRTSGICQPPVHAIALRRIIDTARRTSKADAAIAEDFARDAWPSLRRWHRWIARHRMSGARGLVTIVHGWESGMDNSPRWDAPYLAVRPGADLPPYVRLDVLKVDDPGQRPSDDEYDRYLWLVEQLRRAGHQPDRVVETSAFLVGDVFVTAVFALASETLADLGAELGAPAAEIAELRKWAGQARDATARSCHPETGKARDFDVHAGTWLDTDSLAAFSPLLCGGLPAAAEERLVATLDGPAWSGHPDLIAAVPPSVSPHSEDFDPRQYWRGPQWPVLIWLFGWAFGLRGWERHASEFRAQGVHLASDGSFGEYYEPFTGEPLGSPNQSWTAAVVLDWLCSV